MPTAPFLHTELARVGRCLPPCQPGSRPPPSIPVFHDSGCDIRMPELAKPCLSSPGFNAEGGSANRNPPVRPPLVQIKKVFSFAGCSFRRLAGDGASLSPTTNPAHRLPALQILAVEDLFEARFSESAANTARRYRPSNDGEQKLRKCESGNNIVFHDEVTMGFASAMVKQRLPNEGARTACPRVVDKRPVIHGSFELLIFDVNLPARE